MSTIDALKQTYEFNRARTLALLDAIEKEQADSHATLLWRPGPGRAHIGWQIVHIAITEEIFATERLDPTRSAKWTELWPRFRGGSTPDDDLPTAAMIRELLSASRARLLETVAAYRDEQLNDRPESLKSRGWRVIDALHVIAWHEPHHQGQAHLAYNLFKAAQANK